VPPSDDLHLGDPDIGHVHLLAGFGPGGQFVRAANRAGEVHQVDVPENGRGARFVASLGVQRCVEYGGQVISGSIGRDGARHDRGRRQDQASYGEPDRVGGLRRRVERRRITGHEPVACRDRPAARFQVPPQGQVRATRSAGEPVVRADDGCCRPGHLFDGLCCRWIGP
jgi:hypothetical protein